MGDGDDDEDVGPTYGIATFCCGCLLWWPLAIFITGWNEQTAVCREWAIDQATEKSHKLSCTSTDKAADGTAVAPGDLGFVSCAVDQTSWKHFTSADFAGLTGITPGLLFGANAADGAALSMTVKMWQCYEHCSRYECRHRRLESNETHSSEGAEERALLTRRRGGEAAGPRRLKSKGSSKSCTQECVDWTYEPSLSGVELSRSFHRPTEATAGCGEYASTVGPPAEPKLGTSYAHAASGAVKLTGGAWKLNTFQVEQLPIDTDVILPDRQPTGTLPNGGAPQTMTAVNTEQKQNTLYTCGPGVEAVGCMEITFKKAHPTTVTILSQISETKGLFKEEGWSASGYWLCKNASSANSINRVCPADITNNFNLKTLSTGVFSCGEDVNTLEKLEEALKSANTLKRWGFRALGFFLFFCSINMCFQPIKSLLGVITNTADSCSDGIPCIGGCIDTMTDIFMGVVKAILCLVAFCCAGACFLFIVAVMWVVMRPVTGSIMFVVFCVCCIGASGLLYSNKDPDGKAKLKERSYAMGTRDGDLGDDDYDAQDDPPADDYDYDNAEE
jgi:hypothetical protein